MEKNNLHTYHTVESLIYRGKDCVAIPFRKGIALLGMLVCLIICSIGLNAQDIEQVVKAKPVKVSGGATASTSFYDVNGEEDTRDPYFWQVMANINFNFWGVVDMPFSAYFAKKNVRYQQPSFQQFGMSPKYKAVTLHLGYRNMTFSNYSLAGLTFLGAGIEYNPKDYWLKASAMYGRFF
jgi:predicted metalloprotease